MPKRVARREIILDLRGTYSRVIPFPSAIVEHLTETSFYTWCPRRVHADRMQIVDDVTFSLPAKNITVLLIDGTSMTVPLSAQCTRQLQLVIHEVQLSFAPHEASPRSSTSSNASSSSICSTPPSRRRSPSSLLLSILSPLLAVNQVEASTSQRASLPQLPPQPPARVHRRQARSLLVDTYRQHVLPLLREQLPPAYLPWIIASETSKKMEEFDRIREDINAILSIAGVDLAMTTPMKRSRSTSTTSSATESDSDGETMSPVTPATSVFSTSDCSTPMRYKTGHTPRSYLLSIPPAQSIPFGHRYEYLSLVSRLSSIANRLSAIRKLQGRYEREEGKRRWLEGLERGRLGDKALRKAFSNGHIQARPGVSSEPIKRSGLWRSWTAADQERSEMRDVSTMHPAMLSPVSDSVFMSDHEECSDEDRQFSLLSTLPSPAPPRRRSASGTGLNLPNLPDLTIEDEIDVVTDKIIVVHHGPTVRPRMPHRDAADEVPSLLTSRSDDSLPEGDEWEEDARMDYEAPQPKATRVERVDRALLPSPDLSRPWGISMADSGKLAGEPDKKFVDWEASLQPREEDDNVRVEVYSGVGVVYAQ